MSCQTPYFSGLGACNALLGKVKGVAITLKGTTFTDATIISDATWKTGIASATPASRNAIILPLRVYENKSPEAEMTTSNLGKMDKTNDPPPAASLYLDTGAYDHKYLHSLAGQKFDVVLFLEGGLVMATRKANNAVKGFRATLETRAGLPLSDNTQQSYKIDLYFDSIDEFKNFVLFTPDWSMDDLKDYVPVGVDLVPLGDLSASTGVVSIGVYKRGTKQGLTGLVVADVTVLDSSGTAPVGSTTLVEVGQGVYTLTINEDVGGSASALDAGEWATIQVAKIVSTFITYQSQVEKITAV